MTGDAEQEQTMSSTERTALHQARHALRRASEWLQGEYAKGPDTPGAQVQILVNDALAEVDRVLREDKAEAT